MLLTLSQQRLRDPQLSVGIILGRVRADAQQGRRLALCLITPLASLPFCTFSSCALYRVFIFSSFLSSCSLQDEMDLVPACTPASPSTSSLLSMFQFWCGCHWERGSWRRVLTFSVRARLFSSLCLSLIFPLFPLSPFSTHLIPHRPFCLAFLPCPLTSLHLLPPSLSPVGAYLLGPITLHIDIYLLSSF